MGESKRQADRCSACGAAGVLASGLCRACGDADRTWAVPAGADASDAPPGEPGPAKRSPAPVSPAPAAAERYELLETLGRGAVGTVYKVHDRELDEVIALKVLEPMLQADREMIERFKQELKLARRINHPNVARVFDLVTWQGRLAISQELVPGRTLQAILANGPLPIARLRHYFRYLASGVDAAHRIGVVHRDLKPGNIIIDPADRPRVLDFGLAVARGQQGREAGRWIVGTPAYMAPEQATAPDRADPRSDIYSLGVILFEMATGRLPFPGRTPTDALAARLAQAPPAPSHVLPGLPPGLDRVVLRCLARDPLDRYPSAREAYEDLADRLDRGDTRHPAGAPPPVAQAPGLKGRVLLVDDDPALRAMLRAMLQALGIMAIEASNGMEGVEAAVREKPDLILLDLIMPVLDGRETLRILGSNPATASIPVVMLSGLSDPDEALYSREIGARAFLNKPIAPDVLELLIERYIG